MVAFFLCKFPRAVLSFKTAYVALLPRYSELFVSSVFPPFRYTWCSYSGESRKSFVHGERAPALF